MDQNTITSILTWFKEHEGLYVYVRTTAGLIQGKVQPLKGTTPGTITIQRDGDQPDFVVLSQIASFRKSN